MKEAEVFEMLMPLLVKAIPQAVASLELSKPLCRLRVYYYDTHVPCTYLALQPATTEWRAGLLALHRDKAREYLWLSGEDGGDAPRIDLTGSEEIADLFSQVYDLLCHNEEKYMVLFRAMLHRVCSELNGKNWRDICAVTEDFVVVPADGSMHFCDDYIDIVQSIPQDRLRLLWTKGLGPPDDWAESGDI